jgi:putative CocE/NonD family hydrolase
MSARSRVLAAILSVSLAVLLVLSFPNALSQRRARGERVSRFGEYRGYAAETYNGSQRTSKYLTLKDGTRLAYDLYLPARDRVPAAGPLPVLFKYTPYGRTWTVFDKNGNNNLAKLMPLPWYYNVLLKARVRLAPHGNLLDHLWRTKWLGRMVTSGYAVVVVERPGTGASFGKLNFAPDRAVKETDEILNWIAAQPWSDGHIGMFGDSIQAQVQFQAAATGNPHLKAILPATTWMDSYGLMFPGGVRNIAFLDFYVRANRAFDALATPVDEDTDGALLARAREERGGAGLAGYVEGLPRVVFRDANWERSNTLYPLLASINRAGVPVYLIDGWYDICDRDDFVIYANLSAPKRLLVRPVDHSEIESPGPDVDFGAEAHRWFDYWLKGIKNGIMDEPPIHYYVQRADKTAAWRSADVWPLRQAETVRYYLGREKSGVLTQSPPASGDTADVYTVDYTTTSGDKPRWSAPASAHKYPNMRSNDAKALTYTTPPLETTVDVAGHPIVRVWIATDAPDLDVFAYLEEVDAAGNSTYVTEGTLRASHRALGKAPYDNLGLPFHAYAQGDQAPIPSDKPVELVFDLLPTAWRFSPGRQMRLTIAFADAGNFDTPILIPAPTLHVLRNAAHPSSVDLPVVPRGTMTGSLRRSSP